MNFFYVYKYFMNEQQNNIEQTIHEYDNCEELCYECELRSYCWASSTEEHNHL